MSYEPNDKERLIQLIDKMDDMLNNNQSYYFDVFDFELVCEHYFQKNEVQKVISILNKALEIHPNTIELYILQAQAFLVNKEFKKALSLINYAEGIEDNNGELILLKAEIYSELNEHTESIKYYELFLEIGDEELFNIVLNDLAWEYELIEDYEKAIECLKKSLELFPEDDSLLFEIAFFYDLLNKKEESIKYYETYIDENPYSFNAWFNLGNVYSDLKLYEKAEEAYDFSIVIKDDFAAGYFNKGNVLFKIENYKKAIENYFEALKYEPENSLTYCYLAECYEKLENYDIAENFYEKALEIDDKIEDGLIGIAIIKDLKDELQQGIPYLEKAVVLYPNSVDAWYILAEAQEKDNRLESAQISFEKAYELEPENDELTLDYSNFLAKHIAIDDAIELLYENYTEHHGVKVGYRLGTLYLMDGKIHDGLDLIEECLEINYEIHTSIFEYFPEAKNLPLLIELISKK